MKFKFNVELIDKTKKFCIKDISTMKNPKDNTLIFIRDFKEEYLKKIIEIKNSILILNHDYAKYQINSQENFIIYSSNPRAEYSRILKGIMEEELKKIKILKQEDKNIIIGDECIIEDNVSFGSNISIGNNCIIKSGVKICDNVKIGDRCYIGENSVIAGQGIGVLKDENDNIYNPLHIGGIIIGNDVEIGPLCNIVSGRIEPSIISDNVIIGGSAYIAHDVKIEKNTLINVRAVICGNVEIGKNVVIGPNSTISDNLKIKDNAIVSLGSTVVSKVRSGETVTGNFAVPHKKFLQIMKFLLLKSEE